MRKNIPQVLPYLDGILLATNACEETFLVIDGFGCHSDRAERFAGNHDLFSSLLDWRGFHRVLTTEIESADLVCGSEGRLYNTLEKLIKTVRPRAIVVTPSSTLAVSGQYTSYDFTAFEKRTRIPVLELVGPILEQDWLDGYADFLSALVEARLRRPVKPARPSAAKKSRSAVMVGHLMGRNEFDEAANLETLRTLTARMGIRVESIWLSGGKVTDCLRASPDGVIGLPYGRDAAARLSKALRKKLVMTGLPVGFEGTSQWLLALGEAFGRKRMAKKVIDQELRRWVPRFEWAVVNFLAGRSVVVCADPYLAEGLVPFLEEMGLKIPLLVLETRHEHHGKASAFGQVGTLVTDPAHNTLTDELRRLDAQGSIDLIIGNSMKKDMLPSDRVPHLELGVPSYRYHCFCPSPYLGYEGAAFLLQRIVNTLNLR